MNTIAFLILSSFYLLGPLLIQDNPKIPNAVIQAFNRNFNDPSDVTWKRINNGFEVAFDLLDVAHAARYTADGELQMVKMELRQEDLPAAILQQINEHYRRYPIDEIAQIKMANRLLIQLGISSRTDNKKLVFSPNGEIEEDVAYWE